MQIDYQSREAEIEAIKQLSPRSSTESTLLHRLCQQRAWRANLTSPRRGLSFCLPATKPDPVSTS